MKKTIFTCAVACFIICFSCSKESSFTGSEVATAKSPDQLKAGVPKTFLIKKGAHSSKPDPFTFTKKSSVRFSAVFDSSCIYKTVDPSNQADINKLYGFSDCGEHHLTNSARIGWRWSTIHCVYSDLFTLMGKCS